MKPVFPSVLTGRGGRWIARLAVVVGAVGTLAYLSIQIGRGDAADKLATMNAELERVQAEIAERKDEVSKRVIHVRSLKSDPRAIEDMARDRLQMVYPNEITLRVRQPVKGEGQ